MQNEQPTYIKTLGEFMDWVDRLGPRKCLFRGLPNQEHSIEASAWRRLKNEQDSNNIDKLLEINNGLIRDARLRGYGEKDEQKRSDLEILAELQHFRAATFLIDFTYSPQVALWFACRESFKDSQNSKELSDGKVCMVYVDLDRILEVPPELSQDISLFFEANADGTYPLYWWEPGELNSRILQQHSVFLFGTTRTIEPDGKCIILADDKRAILDSIEGFSQTTETTLFPDFDGFVYQRTQYRPYVPEDYERYRAAGYRASQSGDYKDAIPYFDEALRLNPTEADVYYWRGESKYHLRKFEDAIPDFNKAIKLKDDDLNYYRFRGYTKQSIDQFKDARDDFVKALELAQQSEDTPVMNSIIDSIQFKLREINLQIAQGDQWTPERFKELVPEEIREHYDSRIEGDELYSLGANFQTLLQDEGWKLDRRFGRYYFVYCHGRKRVFGVNLFGVPRLAIWGTESMESEFSQLECVPTYYPWHKQWVFPREVTVEKLRETFKSISSDDWKWEQATLF